VFLYRLNTKLDRRSSERTKRLGKTGTGVRSAISQLFSWRLSHVGLAPWFQIVSLGADCENANEAMTPDANTIVVDG